MAKNIIFEENKKSIHEDQPSSQDNLTSEITFEAACIPVEVKSQRFFESLEPFLVEKETQADLDIHVDGTNFLGQSFIQSNVSYSINKKYLSNGKHLNTKATPFNIICGKETKQLYQDYNYLNGILIGDAITQKYYLKNGKTVTLRLRFINGDNKGIFYFYFFVFCFLFFVFCFLFFIFYFLFFFIF